MQKRRVKIEDLGSISYSEALALQKEQVAALKQGADADSLFLLEHPEVYTLGRKGQRLLADAPALSSMPQLVPSERGGEATYHNPGQLVAYPILKLVGKERSVPWYMRALETVLIELLRTYGIACEAREGATGVWLVGKNKKIASQGVAITSWVTYHGIALNISNDLRGFARIQPCGFSASVMANMQEQLGENCPTLSQVKQDFVRVFCEVLEREPVYQPSFPIASTGQAIMASSH